MGVRERTLSDTVLIIKGVRESTLSVGKSRARNPTQNPTQKPTPNRPEPGRTMQRLRTAPCPQALRSARDAWRAHGPSSEETADGSNKSENQKEKNQLNSQLSTTLTTQHPKGIAARITPHSITPKSTRHTRRDGARRAK